MKEGPSGSAIRSLIHALLAVITAGVLIPTELLAQPRPAFCGARDIFCANCATTMSVITRKNTKRAAEFTGPRTPTAGAYQPRPGYVGKDYFEVEISYERLGTKLKTTLKANVTITD